jgi:hypothetical protein
MPDSKLRIIASSGPAVSQRQDSAAARIGCVDMTNGPGAEENLRLLKAFGRVDDRRRRAWLLELVEHFAGLDAAAH